MSVWYLAADDELLLDLDDYTRPARGGGPWGEVFFRRRLRDAMMAGKLDVQTLVLTRSASAKHWHAIVRLKAPRSALERLVWQLALGSDLYRGRADLMRLALGIPSPSLLILPAPIANFYRPPDRVCQCTEKHRTEEQYALAEQGAGCPVWQELRGQSPWELFGAPSHGGRAERAVPLPAGVVPLGLVLRTVPADEDGFRVAAESPRRDITGSIFDPREERPRL